MANRYAVVAILAASLFGSACATYTPPKPLGQTSTSQLSEGFSAPRDELVRELVDFAATSNIFFLDNLDSQTGMLFLRFIPDTPRNYVDCGNFTRPWVPFRYYSYSGPYNDFLLTKLDAKLTVRLVVALSEMLPKQTKVTVSGRFELQSRQESSFTWTLGRIMNWEFTSGSPITNQLQRPAWGSVAARTCQSTLDAESAALGLIAELAKRLQVVSQSQPDLDNSD